MKTLKESLFDVDKKLDKNLTFGDFFMIDNEIDYGERSERLKKEWSYTRIKKDTHATGKTDGETIFNGIVKLIYDIKLTGNSDEFDKRWLVGELTYNLHKYLLADKKKKYWANNGLYIYIAPHSKNGLVVTRDVSIIDSNITEIIVVLGDYITLKFVRK